VLTQLKWRWRGNPVMVGEQNKQFITHLIALSGQQHNH